MDVKYYIVYDLSDDELPVMIGTSKDVAEWLGVNRTRLYQAAKISGIIKQKYRIVEIDSLY